MAPTLVEQFWQLLEWLWNLISQVLGRETKHKYTALRKEEEEELRAWRQPVQVATFREEHVEPEEAEPPSTSQNTSSLGSYALIIMRHGHRQDEVDDSWSQQSDRPWDPPLSETGRQQAKAVGERLRHLGVDYVVTSPFLRCMQTSAEIVAALQLPQGRWLVDVRMCEVCDPRLLFGGNKELQARCVAAGKTESWLWGAGRSLVQTMAALAAAEGEAGASGVCISPCAAPWNLTAGAALPAVPERLPAALARYEAAVRSIGDQMLGRKVLVVTHGEALRAVVAMAAKEAVVYEVEHTGYVKLTRRPAAAGSTGGGRGSDDGSSGCVKWGEWQLETKSGETGVMWCT